MRTTIDLPDDLHELAREIARSSGETLSHTVAALLRSALGRPGTSTIRIDPRSGLPMILLGHRTTEEDVRSLDDEE